MGDIVGAPILTGLQSGSPLPILVFTLRKRTGAKRKEKMRQPS